MSLSDTRERQEARDAPTTPVNHRARRGSAPCRVVVYDTENDDAWVEGQSVDPAEFR